MRIRSPEAVTWLVSVAVGGFALLCGVAFVYEKSRKKIEHPELGRLTYDWGSWSGTLPHYQGESVVRFEFPGKKAGPTAEQCEELLSFWKSLKAKVGEAHEAALEEFLDIKDAYEDTPEASLVAQIEEDGQDPSAFEKHWVLVGVNRVEDSPYLWSLEFEVAWDPEHTRSAYFDSEGALYGYGLTCAEPWEDED
ncbi:MAG: hypothetical protein KC800_20780 [Candidatus Eremiobacteraeota bacterium]|nr:hypothetical protein [Candidatus Eremiobacteraeota bacterium]